jgi:hypothetical protein
MFQVSDPENSAFLPLSLTLEKVSAVENTYLHFPRKILVKKTSRTPSGWFF